MSLRGYDVYQVQLIALDLDGTILEKGRVIDPRLVATLQQLSTRGVRVTTATGRPLGFQLQLFGSPQLAMGAGLPHALIADEREIFFREPGGIGYQSAYQPHRPWNKALRARWHDLHPVAMAWLSQAQGEATRRGWEAVPHEPEPAMYERGLPTLQLGGPTQASAIYEWLQLRLLESGIALSANRNGRLVQLHDAIAGKGPVLLELARYWSLEPSQILAIGDSINDLSMVDGRYGFRCGTTSNADESVKAAVRQAGGIVASAPIGAGVLEILEALQVTQAAPMPVGMHAL